MDTQGFDAERREVGREKAIRVIVEQIYREAMIGGLTPLDLAAIWLLGRLKQFDLDTEQLQEE